MWHLRCGTCGSGSVTVWPFWMGCDGGTGGSGVREIVALVDQSL